jgi:uncharacterized NAD(P)/FAD-binding protein YdhS
MRAAGRLEILKGRLRIIANSDGKFTVKYTTVGIENEVTADVLVNCIGSESNFTKIDSPFVKILVDRGYVL